MEIVRGSLSSITAYLPSISDKNTFFQPGQDQTQWLLSTLYIVLKEYMTVIIFLVCFTRVEVGDFFTGSLILFMMLVSFGFPFLSSYLFLVLRFGPWCSRDLGYMGWVRLLIQTVLVITAQIGGACTAAVFIKNEKHIWEKSGMTINGAANTTSWAFRGVDAETNIGLLGLEEGLNSLIFLVGLLHLMEADAGKMMANAFFQPAVLVPVDKEAAVTEQVSSSEESVSQSGNVTPKINRLKVLPPIVDRTRRFNSYFLGGDQGYERLDYRRKDDDGNPYTTNVPIPVTFILHVCLLLAATSRAFPTAHGTPAVSVYLREMGFISNEIMNSRIIGGSLGAILALVYYYVWYVLPANHQGSITETFIKTLIVAPPAFLTGQLQLPAGMNKKS